MSGDKREGGYVVPDALMQEIFDYATHPRPSWWPEFEEWSERTHKRYTRRERVSMWLRYRWVTFRWWLAEKVAGERIMEYHEDDDW